VATPHAKQLAVRDCFRFGTRTVELEHKAWLDPQLVDGWVVRSVDGAGLEIKGVDVWTFRAGANKGGPRRRAAGFLFEVHGGTDLACWARWQHHQVEKLRLEVKRSGVVVVSASVIVLEELDQTVRGGGGSPPGGNAP